MNFQDLHELLRLELLRRIDRGELTGTRLAQQTNFRQAHISNFLNRKRSLSLEGLDRVLAAQNLTVEQILPVDISGSAASSLRNSLQQDPIEIVPVIAASAAMSEARIQSSSVLESFPVPASRLSDSRSRPSQIQASWQRFVAIRLDVQQVTAMEPLLSSDSIAVVDRHYNSLVPHRAHQPTLYAVRYGMSLLFRFVTFADGHLILRPLSVDFPVQLLAVGPNERPSDCIVGRVCLLSLEL